MRRQDLNQKGENKVEKGTVKWFSSEKGYGFITPTAGGKDIFVHYTGIDQIKRGPRNLAEGDSVIFERVDGPKGDQAVNVKKV